MSRGTLGLIVLGGVLGMAAILGRGWQAVEPTPAVLAVVMSERRGGVFAFKIKVNGVCESADSACECVHVKEVDSRRGTVSGVIECHKVVSGVEPGVVVAIQGMGRVFVRLSCPGRGSAAAQPEELPK